LRERITFTQSEGKSIEEIHYEDMLWLQSARFSSNRWRSLGVDVDFLASGFGEELRNNQQHSTGRVQFRGRSRAS